MDDPKGFPIEEVLLIEPPGSSKRVVEAVSRDLVARSKQPPDEMRPNEAFCARHDHFHFFAPNQQTHGRLNASACDMIGPALMNNASQNLSAYTVRFA